MGRKWSFFCIAPKAVVRYFHFHFLYQTKILCREIFLLFTPFLLSSKIVQTSNSKPLLSVQFSIVQLCCFQNIKLNIWQHSHSKKTKAMASSSFSFANPSSLLGYRTSPSSALNPRAMAKELHFNHDGATTKKLLVWILEYSGYLTPAVFIFFAFQQELCELVFVCVVVVQAGVDLVAELLGVTLGPKGRNVVLHNKYGPPKIVNDGETVLKEVFFFFSIFSRHSPSPICFFPLLMFYFLVVCY